MPICMMILRNLYGINARGRGKCEHTVRQAEEIQRVTGTKRQATKRVDAQTWID
jgi:hypothetical protein